MVRKSSRAALQGRTSSIEMVFEALSIFSARSAKEHIVADSVDMESFF